MPAPPDFYHWLRSGCHAPAPLLRDLPEPHARLVTAVSQHLDEAQALGPADRLALVRAVRRWETVQTFGVEVPLEVGPSWLEGVAPELWELAKCELAGTRFRAADWRPEWLGARETGEAVDTPLYQTELRRNDPSAPPDPILELLRFPRYQSAAQREAARTVWTAPPGATVVVDLPTGSGKTACGLLPALRPLPGTPDLIGVTPFVVPTVALALDQERRLRDAGIVTHPTAYRPERKDDADAIRGRVAAGAQGPLFVSPESLTGALRQPLLRAAAAGVLRAFVVDEAHMISAWGDEFRPAFQQIAGLRRELLGAARIPFVTALLSATLTEYHLQTLRHLFGQPGPFHVVHAVRLRPEPSYWSAHSPNESARRERVSEAVAVLPRPLILYTTKREDARYWADHLWKVGYRRLGRMDGRTPATERERLLAAWRDDELDVMVATSAFGLGVDKGSVRAVVHATLPEGVDRFYQDVGRGGRDGRASVSVLIHTTADRGTAEALMTPTFIGPDRGRSRWEGMFYSPRRRVCGGGVYGLPIDELPNDLGRPSDENERWNVRTLLLMARSGLLDITAPPATTGGGDSDDGFVYVQLKSERHNEAAAWDHEVEDNRQNFLAGGERAFKLFDRLLRGEECVGAVLAACYTSTDPAVPVVRACGGCPACRRNGALPAGRLVARHSPPEPWPTAPLGQDLSTLLGSVEAAMIYYPGASADANPQLFVELARWLLEQGVVNVVAGRSFADALAPVWRGSTGHGVLLWDVPPTGTAARQPAAVVLVGLDTPDWPSIGSWLLTSGAPTVLVASDHLPAPDAPHRRFRDVWTAYPQLSLAAWEEVYRL